MSFSTARRDIEKRLNDNWSTTEIAWDNVKFSPVNGTAWVACHIFEDTVNRINIGVPGQHRVTGTVVINIMLPEGGGTDIARQYGDTLAAIFRDAQFSGITFRETTLNNTGINEGWYQFNLVIPFYWDGIYT